MNSTQISTLAVSILALVASVVMLWRTLRRQKIVPAPERPRQFRRFTKRRILMSVLVAVVGIMLFTGVFCFQDYFTHHPREFGYFWVAVIVVLLWLLGLAVADIYSVLNAQLAEFYRKK